MKEYKVDAECVGVATIYVWAENEDEALEKAAQEVGGMHEEEWYIHSAHLLENTLQEVPENE